MYVDYMMIFLNVYIYVDLLSSTHQFLEYIHIKLYLIWNSVTLIIIQISVISGYQTCQ